jgi:K+/H+ antiporter YhaU regulatory subunit KhtT
MPEVYETRLPGVGVRHDFTTAEGERVAVLTHRGGRRELAVYERDDHGRLHVGSFAWTPTTPTRWRICSVAPM